jgi:uncharacterized membrane protein YfcA
MTVPNELLGVGLGFVVGIVLGLLGGGGSILAVPIFLFVFRVPARPAFAMSLAVVGMSAFIGFLGHWRQGSVNLRVGLPFGGVAMVAAFVTARLSTHVPDTIRLTLFALFAFTAAIVMLFDSLRPVKKDAVPGGQPHFTPLLAVEATGVGALTALIGAGGGFVIVPALVYLAGVPVKEAVGSSLLIITLNSLSGFAGYIGQVPIDWSLVGVFTSVAALGAILGTRLNRYVPQVRIKQGFALLILILLSIQVLRTLVA